MWPSCGLKLARPVLKNKNTDKKNKPHASYNVKKKDKRTKTNIISQDKQTKPLLHKPTSPRRLREGGVAILQALNKNHHMAIPSSKFITTLLINKLGLCLPSCSHEI
jgi:hypothetical protein